MKRFLIAGAVTLVIVGFSLAIFFPNFISVANKDFPHEGDEPDLPAFLRDKGNVTKEEFMLLRAENVALLRGFDKDKPFDPKDRIEGIRQLENQEETLAAGPDSPEKDSLLAAWTAIGPNPIPNGQVGNGPQLAVSGRTVAIVVHPTNPNLVYVGTAQGGLYRTTDGGAIWTPMLDSALSLAVNTVAIAPSQPDTIFVGTGESGFSGSSFFGVGIYRIDNASTATPTIVGPIGGANFTGRAIGKIVVHPTNPNIIFASSTSGIGGIGGASNNVLADRGLFRSTDALSAAPTFTKLTITGLAAQTRNVLDIAIDPGNPDLVLCTVADSFGLGEGGVYRSINALAPAPTFVRTFTAGVGTDASRTELALHRSGAGVVTVYAASGFNGGTLQRSIDGGATFTQQIDNNFCSSQCFYDIAVEVDPVNADRVYLGGSPTLPFGFSINGGTSFTNSSTGLHVDTHAIAAAPSLPSTVYFGSDGGIYKSLDSGVTWASLNNTTFSATQFMGLAVHPTDPNFTIGGTQDNGTNFYRPDATWNRADFGDGGYAVIDQSALNTTAVNMYHTYFNSATLKGYGFTANGVSPTEGTWVFRGCNSVAGNGIPCGGSILFYAPLEQGPGTPNTIYYGADTLYRSADTGLNHTAVSQNFGTSPISAIGISPQNDNVRIVGLTGAGTTPGGLFGTTTGSAVLTNLDIGNAVPDNFIARAVIDPNNVNTAYVTLSAFGVANVWRTTNLNAGAPTWTDVVGSGANTLPQVPVSSFLVDPLIPNNLYAGTDIGVYASTDGGTNWAPLGTGLPRIAVFGLEMAPGRIVRAATHGKGMYQIPALLAPFYEADVDPRGSGNQSTQSGDVVQMRLFLNCTGTQPDSVTNEFQRADSSPFDPATNTYGDGRIQSDDIVQTRRYVNMSDAGRPAAGLTAPIAPRCGSQPPPVADGQQNEPMAETLVAAPEGGIVRQLRVQSAISSSPAGVTVNILADAVGDEAEYGFTVNYTSTILTNPVVSNGTAGAGVVSCNTTTSPGRIFCSVGSFPTNRVGDPNIGEIAPGINQVLIRVTFTVPSGVAPQMTAVTLTDVNASRDTAPLALTIGSQNGTVTITGPTAASVSISGRVLTARRRGIGNARVTLTDSSGNSRIAVTTSFGYYNFADVAAGETYVIGVAARRYVFSQPTRIISVNENISALDFTAEN